MWSQLEPIQAALTFMQLGLECLNLNNTWCVLYVAQMNNASTAIAAQPNGGECNSFSDSTSCGNAARGCYWNTGKNPPDCEDSYVGPVGTAKLNTICHPCVGAFIWRSLVIINLEDQFNLPDNGTVPRDVTRLQLMATLFVRSGICSTDLKDNYCVAEVQSANPNFGGGICTALSSIVQQTGCCAASVIAFEMGVCQVAVLLGQNTTCVSDIGKFAGALQACAAAATPVNLGPTCAEIKYAILVKLVLTGLDLAWYGKAGNPALLLAIVERIIAFNGGVNASAVTAQTSTSRRLLQAGGVGITATVNVGSASEYYTVNQGLSKNANIETLDLNQNVPSSGVNPVQLTSSGVNPTTSSATKTVGGAVVALLVAVGVALA